MDISQQVSKALNDELSQVESQIAEKYGAVEVTRAPEPEKIEEVKKDLEAIAEITIPNDKGKEEQSQFKPESIVVPVTANGEVKPEEKKITKETLVTEILELQKGLGRDTMKEPTLKRMKKSELELIRNALFEDGVTKITGVKSNGTTEEITNTMVENMFAINIALCQLTETATDRFKDNLGGINILDGWTKQMQAEENTMIPILRKIYSNNRTQIDKYLSPVMLWAMVMTTSASRVIIRNTKKKLKNSETLEMNSLG